jgi:hypothetical protein
MGAIVRVLKRVVYYAGYPFYGYLDARFADVLDQLHFQHGKTIQILKELEDLRGQMTALNAAQTSLREELSSDARVASESFVYMEAVAGRVEARLDTLEKGVLNRCDAEQATP